MHNYFYVEHVIQDFMVNLSYKLSESDGVDVLHREPLMGRWWDPTHASVFLSYFAEGLPWGARVQILNSPLTTTKTLHTS